MSQAKLAKILKIFICVMCVGILVVYGAVLPIMGKEVVGDRYDACYWPWLIFLWFTAIPVIIGMVHFWKIVMDIQADKSFTDLNAERLKNISLLAFVDVGYYFVGNVIFAFLKMNSPMMFGVSIVIDAVGIAVAIAAALLAHLVTKAARLREDAELTI